MNETSRRAARTATFAALPLALIVGAGTFGLLWTHRTPTGPVSMAAPKLDAADAEMCLALIAKLPVKVRDITQRHVTAGTEQNAAYGDPPLTVACGVVPVTAPATATIYPLSGVCWYATTGKTSSVWTTLDRQVPVRVTVPNSLSPAGQWVNEFAAPLATSIPSIKTPYDCAP